MTAQNAGYSLPVKFFERFRPLGSAAIFSHLVKTNFLHGFPHSSLFYHKNRIFATVSRKLIIPGNHNVHFLQIRNAVIVGFHNKSAFPDIGKGTRHCISAIHIVIFGKLVHCGKQLVHIDERTHDDKGTENIPEPEVRGAEAVGYAAP